MLTANYVFLACKNQVDHSGQIVLEFCLVISVAPWRVTARAVFFTEVAEVARRGDQDIIQKYGGIAFYAKAIGEFGITKVFTDERNFTGIPCRNFLGQQ